MRLLIEHKGEKYKTKVNVPNGTIHASQKGLFSNHSGSHDLKANSSN